MSNGFTIYALRVAPEVAEKVYSSLKGGEGRFGWSYIETANLYELRKRISDDGWDSLSDEEGDCYQAFLLDIREDDYVVYINVPEWGKCTLARVNKPYYWRYEDDDFNHRFGVDPELVFDFDRNDEIVHPCLSARLKLQGRWWCIDGGQEKFEQLVESLEAGRAGAPRTSETNRDLLVQGIQPLLDEITKKIHETHPNRALEDLLAECFKNVSGVKKVEKKGGPRDRGADLLVAFESAIPIPPQICVIQVKSFEGEHWSTRAVDDIKRAFEHYPEADMGLIVSTASSSSDVLDRAIEELQRETGKSVSLLIGKAVADFVLRFGQFF